MFFPSAASITHSTYVHYIGYIGSESTALTAKVRGFVSVRGGIATSGLSQIGTFANAILLTTKSLDMECLKSGHVYAVTCKLIASNTPLIDHLYFNKDNAIDFGKFRGTPLQSLRMVTDRVSMTVHGCVSRHCKVSTESARQGTLVLTVECEDRDPVTSKSVVWFTKHYVTERIQCEQQMSEFQSGSEIISHGMVKDYDEKEEAWEIEVESLTLIQKSENDAVRKRARYATEVHSNRSASTNPVVCGSPDYSDITLGYGGVELSLKNALDDLFDVDSGSGGVGTNSRGCTGITRTN